MLLRSKGRLRELAALYKSTCIRTFASVPEPVSVEQGEPETLKLSPSGPLLLALQDRQWGAASILPPVVLPPGEIADRIAVIRDAFRGSHEMPQPLSTIVAQLGNGSVAVASDLSQPHRRLVVDEYQQGRDGTYTLQQVATDLFRFLHREGLRVAHVPDIQAAKQGFYNSAQAAVSRGPRQSTNEVVMVAPTAFGFNPQAAQDNSFMHSSTSGQEQNAQPGTGVTTTVLQEFAGLYRELSEVAGVKVNLFQHSLAHGTPDACFPNNWFSTHPAGEASGGTTQSTLVFYPMKCPNRAMERRLDMQSVLRAKGYSRVIDLSSAEKDGSYFEGTGALVLDRINGVAYVALSERADLKIAQHWVDKLGYKDLVAFHSCDPAGKPVYHTNVLMAIGTDVAVVCLESVRDKKERQHLKSRLSAHHEVVDITQQQMAALCGNVLELEDGRGLAIFAMSSQAYNAFTVDQRKVLRRHVAELHHAPINTLEHIGGGGVRCALGEVF